MRLPAQDKLTIIKLILSRKTTISEVSRTYSVSRKAIYSWLKSYTKATSRQKTVVLEPRYIKGRQHPRAYRFQLTQTTLRLISKDPSLSASELTKKINDLIIHQRDKTSLRMRQLGQHTERKTPEIKSLEDTRRSSIKTTYVIGAVQIKTTTRQISQPQNIVRHKVKTTANLVGRHAVVTLLKELRLSTLLERENFSRLYNGPKRLHSDIRRQIVREVLEENQTVSKVSRKWHLARKTVHGWIKKYRRQDNRSFSRSHLAGSADRLLDGYRRGFAHPKALTEDQHQAVLSQVIKNPQESIQTLARTLKLSSHGVWNVLKAYSLTRASSRIAFAEAVSQKQSLSAWQIPDRIRSVWEKFTPQMAPAPPPMGADLSAKASAKAAQSSEQLIPPILPEPPAISRQLVLNYLLSTFRNLVIGLFRLPLTQRSPILAALVAFAIPLSVTVFLIATVSYISIFISAPTLSVAVGYLFASVALAFGFFFFLYSFKYYSSVVLVLMFSRNIAQGDTDVISSLSTPLEINSARDLAKRSDTSAPGGLDFSPQGLGVRNDGRRGTGLIPDVSSVTLDRHPFVSIHLPLYNEKRVVNRLLEAVTSMEYDNFEVIVADDSTDETKDIVLEWKNHPKVKISHRESREGFKGGALREALKFMDKRTEFVLVFDSDFLPYPDTVVQFLKYFQVTCGSLNFSTKSAGHPGLDPGSPSESGPTGIDSRFRGNDNINFIDNRIAAIQGYQWHVLNKSENWITRGVRTEYAGSYVIERSGAEIYQGLKQIAGSVYMIRADILKAYGWGTSITEDLELTLKLYRDGYKVVYTPYIQAPSECVSTIKRLVRQRMRWAEGHSYNVKRLFWSILMSKNAERSEKFEFLYLSPYYLQSFFFLVGTLFWFLSETVLQVRLPFWTQVWGWSLVLTNILSLPLMNMVGMFLEEAEEKDYLGVFSFVLMTYIVAPFQAYASVKGFLEKEEGPWFRTPKTGHITDVLKRGRFFRFISGILPGRAPALAKTTLGKLAFNSHLSLTHADYRFATPPIEHESSGGGIFAGSVNFTLFGKGVRIAKRYFFTKAVLASFLAIVMFLNYLALFVYETSRPPVTEITQEGRQDQLADTSSAPTGEGTASGQVIATLPKVNTNLVENPQTRAVDIKKGQVLAAEEVNTSKHLPDRQVYGNESLMSAGTEVYRWQVELPNKTVFSFGQVDTKGIRPVVKVRHKDGWFVRFTPDYANISEYVEPKVEGNTIEWEIADGIIAKYTVLRDRVKADYIVSHQSQVTSNKLDFLVQYNDEFSGESGEELVNGKGYLTHELFPDGSIHWLGENGRTYFEFPEPIIRDKDQNEFAGSYTIEKISQGTSLLSINIPSEVLSKAEGPITVDPVTIDTTANAEATGFGGGRRLLRDAFGNLFLACDCGTGDDNIYYRQYNLQTWTDANIDLNDAGTDAAEEPAMDLAADTGAELHVAYNDATDDDLKYRSFNINYNGDNTVSSISNVTTEFAIDTAGTKSSVDIAEPSLVIANKGEGATKEKVTLVWKMSTVTGGNRDGEIRFLQCDVSDGCDLASEWKNASEERSGTMPSDIDSPGSADVIFESSGTHTIYHATHIQVPGRPVRTPNFAKWDDNGAFSNLTSALDDNSATSHEIGGLSSTQDYLYFGDTVKFSRIVVDMDADAGDDNTTGRFVGGTVQYCSDNSVGGEDTTCDTWSSLLDAADDFIDNTDDATNAFGEDGSILFNEPSDWVLSTENTGKAYWARFRPTADFDSQVQIDEFEVTDRHAKDLLIVGGGDIDDNLRAAYVIWDGAALDKWENIPGTSTVPAPWREDGGGANSALDATGADWAVFIEFPLSITADYINNAIYVSFVDNETTDVLTVKKSFNNLSLTASASWTDTAFPTVTEGTDIVLSLASYQNEIYLFYVLDPGTNNLVWARCNPRGGGSSSVCDNGSDWPSVPPSGTFDNSSTSHSEPAAVISKAFGDSVAIDVAYSLITGLETNEVKYERHFIDSIDKTITVTASADDAFHRDCVSGTDDQDISATTVKLGRDDADADCVTSDSENHAGFRFPSVTVAQGAAISSAYIDFRVSAHTGSGDINFTVYGEDSANAVTDGTGFDSLTNCTDPCSGAIDELGKTTTSSSQAINFNTTSYRIDVTDIVQEIVCQGLATAQPCVGNFFEDSGDEWASGNAIALLLISGEGELGADNFVSIISQDDTGTTTLDPTLQINLGNTNKRFSSGVATLPTNRNDMDHPMETEEFTAVNTDDSLVASVSATLVASNGTSILPIFVFKALNTNNNNTDDITVTAIVKSSIQSKSYGGAHPTGKNNYLQVYNNDGTPGWDTVDCNGPGGGCDTGVAPETDITLTGTVTGATTYYQTESSGGSCTSPTFTDCWAAFRVYQEAEIEANQILYADYFTTTFVPENVLWLLPIALFLPRIVPKLKLRQRFKYLYIRRICQN